MLAMMHAQVHRCFNTIGTGRDRIIAELYHNATASISITFRKTQHRVPVRGASGVCNFLVFAGKSVHKRRLLKLLLKRGKLLFELGDFVSEVGDFPFELHEAFRVGCGDGGFICAMIGHWLVG